MQSLHQEIQSILPKSVTVSTFVQPVVVNASTAVVVPLTLSVFLGIMHDGMQEERQCERLQLYLRPVPAQRSLL
jgi:hypothetical protein